MKKLTHILQLQAVLIMLALLFLLVGCTDTSSPTDPTDPTDPVTVTVTFLDGDDTHATATIEEGSTLTLPDDPTRTGSMFAGWTY